MEHFTHKPQTGGLVKSWTNGVPVEAKAREQVERLAALPFIHKHVAVMPDVHYGVGATVGSVFATRGAVIPAAVGVDIGCGMVAVETTLAAADLPDSLGALRSRIELLIPHGQGSWNDNPSRQAEESWRRIGGSLYFGSVRHAKLIERVSPVSQLGTLGGGNHFVELCLDETGTVWVMLHSGSRGIGNRIGTYYIERAKEEMRRWFVNLPDADLAYLPRGSTFYSDYLSAVEWAQEYARENRKVMLQAVLVALRSEISKPFSITNQIIDCHHNYVSLEHHFGENVLVTRKGAVRARPGEYGIIPGSMGARSFIVRGKGHPDSFCSCSHGAGRAMSRGEAERRFTVEEHKAATAGVECRKDAGVLDETPGAYKDIDAVMAAQSELVDIVRVLKQVLCVKG